MQLLHGYIAVERKIRKEGQSKSGIVLSERFSQKKDTVIYSGRDDIQPGDEVFFIHHDEQYMEPMEDGTERKLWLIHPDKVIAKLNKDEKNN